MSRHKTILFDEMTLKIKAIPLKTKIFCQTLLQVFAPARRTAHSFSEASFAAVFRAGAKNSPFLQRSYFAQFKWLNSTRL
jgi:hypothetical protein